MFAATRSEAAPVQSGELWPDKLHHNLSLTQATEKRK